MMLQLVMHQGRQTKSWMQNCQGLLPNTSHWNSRRPMCHGFPPHSCTVSHGTWGDGRCCEEPDLDEKLLRKYFCKVMSLGYRLPSQWDPGIGERIVGTNWDTEGDPIHHSQDFVGAGLLKHLQVAFPLKCPPVGEVSTKGPRVYVQFARRSSSSPNIPNSLNVNGTFAASATFCVPEVS